jgi:hypothetical protein
MNPWLGGLQIATSIVAVVGSIVVFGTLIVVLLKRGRIEELMRTRPYPNPPQYRWLGVALGAALLITFEFVVMPHLAPRLSLRYHIVVSVVGVAIYVALMAALFAGTQRMQTWPVASRLRSMYIMLAAACILAAALLFHVFS